jgi:3-methyladenine DNA glycosylase/8-oxoguanine DNA glycosylase
MAQALVSEYGPPLPADPQRHAFPPPEDLATLDEESLRTVARLGYRAPYVLGLARCIASGELDLEELKNTQLPTPELRKKLLAIKGVGSYAAAHLLILLDRFDFVPIDSWAYKMVSYEWFQGQAIGRDEIEEAFEHWNEWKGMAYWFWDWSYTGEG